jgi:hypothetical protein
LQKKSQLSCPQTDDICCSKFGHIVKTRIEEAIYVDRRNATECDWSLKKIDGQKCQKNGNRKCTNISKP